MAERIAIHQHVWTEPLIEALGRRDSPPFARPANRRFVLFAPGEGPATVAVGPSAVDCRLAELDRDGINRAVVSLSCPMASSRCRAGGPSCCWRRTSRVSHSCRRASKPGERSRQEAGPEDVGGVLDAGFVGVSLPAGALPGTREVEHLGARVLPAPLADGRLRGARGRRACPPLGLVCRGAVPALAAQRLTRVPLADGRCRPRRRSRECCPCAE
jgi:hypothetical protein